MKWLLPRPSGIGWMPPFVRSVHFSEMAPRGYGRAWVQWDTGRRVCMPVPFNFIAGMIRFVYIKIAQGFYHHECCPTCHRPRKVP